jgi:hypothetical protein
MVPTVYINQGVEETVLKVLGRYASTHEVKGRNLTIDR